MGALRSKPIYLDYNASTPIDPNVKRKMQSFLGKDFGNPSSGHAYGEIPRDAIAKAREQVAIFIGARPEEVIFTSCGSESDNHAILGAAFANRAKGKHIITSRIEHPAVLETCRYLERNFKFKITYLPVDRFGSVAPSTVADAITDETILISIMHANNEVGTIEPIEEIGKIAYENDTLFHTDAAQSCGKIRVDVKRMKVDLLTIAGHKLYAPKGIGALYLRNGTDIHSFIHGGGQEDGRRAGTENVPYIVGLGIASEIAERSLPAFIPRIMRLRDKLHARIREGLGADRIRLNGHPERRLPNTLNISIHGTIGEELLSRISEIAASTGSACHSASPEPSNVLIEMGLSEEDALGALRLSLGRYTTESEIDIASNLIVRRAQGKK